jgi:hypothetical protein
LAKNSKGELAFFAIQAPLSCTLNHELGHALQILEAADLGVSKDSALEARYNALWAEEIKGLVPLINADGNHTADEVTDAFYVQVLMLQMWNASHGELPNILPEQDSEERYRDESKKFDSKRPDGRGGFLPLHRGDGEFLRQMMLYQRIHNPQDLEQANPSHPKFFSADGKTTLSDGALASILNVGTILVPWGHLSHKDLGVLVAQLDSGKKKIIFQELALALLQQFGITLDKLPTID